MKNILSIFLLILTFSSCVSDSEIISETIEVEEPVEVEDVEEIEGVDEQEFTVPTEDSDNFRKLEDGIYYSTLYWADETITYGRFSDAIEEWLLLEEADVDTFVILNSYYQKDKDKVFYRNGIYGDVSVVEGANPYTFETLGYNELYEAKDDNNFYMDGVSVDADEITQLNEFYWSDGKYIFTKEAYAETFNTVLRNADASSFEIIDGALAKDKNNVYTRCLAWEGFCVTSIKDADPNSIEDLGYGFTKDNSQVYFYTNVIEGADPESFYLFVDEANAQYYFFVAYDAEAFYAVMVNSSERFQDIDTSTVGSLEATHNSVTFEDANGSYILRISEEDEVLGQYSFEMEKL